MHWFSARKFRPLAALLLAGCGESPPPAASSESTNYERIDALFQHLSEGVRPGAAVLVIKDGEVVIKQGYGYSDLENKVRIDENSSFRLASVSKQFTTMAIMVLAEDGKLAYDDLLVSLIPEFSSWPGVTLRHLMTHTSGIPDYYEEDFYGDFDADAPMPAMSDLVHILSRYPEPDFAPGDEYVYNNAAYEVLALIVERVSGKTFTDFLTERVFQRAGMQTATTFNSARPDIPNRVFGYEKTDDGYELNDYDPFNNMLGDGGVYATLNDFVAWERSLSDNTLVSASTLHGAYTAAQLNNGAATGYGFGWEVGAYRGHEYASHSGSWVGFRTHIVRVPQEKLTIVVLTNQVDGKPFSYIESIDNIYLSEPGNAFVPDESQAAIMEHHRKIPDDEHWWNVRGEEMGWMHRHVDQMFPTVTVYRNGQVRELEYSPMESIGDVEIDTPDGPIPFEYFIHSDHSTAMGVVILHKGKIVFEDYPRMQEYEKPTYWSTTKVLAGAVVRLLEERGRIDVSRPIDFYIPALADSVHAGTTVRNVLDMATGVDCAENYEDPNSCYYEYSEAIGDNVRSAESPDNPYDFLANVEIARTGDQGEKFVYSGATNFLAMWLIEEVTGYPFQDAISKEFWHHIGAENDAGFFAYRYGIAVSHGGFFSKMRDLARFGLLYTPSYSIVSDKKIISDAHIELLLNGGHAKLLQNAGNPADSPIKHNAYMWGSIYKNGYLTQGGWGGQGLIVHPKKDVVAVFTGYFKEDFSEVSLQSAVMKVLEENFTDTE